jgi:5-methyltetrahydropteroyltriglutamate--homocysteine methyltransferase
LALSDEIKDLQNAGIKIIQVDEAAFKEGYPLRKEHVSDYEKWSVDAFKLAVSSADKETRSIPICVIAILVVLLKRLRL